MNINPHTFTIYFLHYTENTLPHQYFSPIIPHFKVFFNFTKAFKLQKYIYLKLKCSMFNKIHYSKTATKYSIYNEIWNLPQWQKSEETTKRLLGSARYLLKSFPNSCSFDSLSAPTNTGIIVNSSLWLISKRKKVVIQVISEDFLGLANWNSRMFKRLPLIWG